MKRLVFAVILLSLFGAGLAMISLFSPYQGFQGESVLDFPKGTSTRAMASQLAREGVIRFPWQFLAARMLRPSAKPQAGEYRFDHAASAFEVFSRIARGDVFFYEVVTPEGSNLFDIAAAVDRTGVIRSADFLKAAAHAALIHDLDPSARTLEGYLFPSTYRITRRTTAEGLCKMMTDQFRKEWKTIGANGTSVHDTVTLASLVEKETGVADERPRVASVFANRLRTGMKLDCDPTTIYAALLDERYRGVIHRSDLDNKNAYNTYQHAGLPPGPIANPGAASLKAALHPEKTDYLYFVAKPGGVGSHNFAADLAGHERNVREYRRGLKAAH